MADETEFGRFSLEDTNGAGEDWSNLRVVWALASRAPNHGWRLSLHSLDIVAERIRTRTGWQPSLAYALLTNIDYAEREALSRGLSWLEGVKLGNSLATDSTDIGECRVEIHDGGSTWELPVGFVWSLRLTLIDATFLDKGFDVFEYDIPGDSHIAHALVDRLEAIQSVEE